MKQIIPSKLEFAEQTQQELDAYGPFVEGVHCTMTTGASVVIPIHGLDNGKPFHLVHHDMAYHVVQYGGESIEKPYYVAAYVEDEVTVFCESLIVYRRFELIVDCKGNHWRWQSASGRTDLATASDLGF